MGNVFSMPSHNHMKHVCSNFLNYGHHYLNSGKVFNRNEQNRNFRNTLPKFNPSCDTQLVPEGYKETFFGDTTSIQEESPGTIYKSVKCKIM